MLLVYITFAELELRVSNIVNVLAVVVPVETSLKELVTVERYPAVPNPITVDVKKGGMIFDMSPTVVLPSWEEEIYPAVPRPVTVDVRFARVMIFIPVIELTNNCCELTWGARRTVPTLTNVPAYKYPVFV